ncbi:RNA polymerase sigma factor [Micromonospora sp. NPDC003197]
MGPVMLSAAIEGTADQAVSDNTIIERSRAVPEKFAAVFDRHSEAVHRYLSRRVGPSIAEALTAETFLVAFRQRERYDLGQSKALPWLYGIATNLLHRQRRTEIRQYKTLVRTGIDPVGNHNEDDVVARVAVESATRRIAEGWRWSSPPGCSSR